MSNVKFETVRKRCNTEWPRKQPLKYVQIDRIIENKEGETVSMLHDDIIDIDSFNNVKNHRNVD